MAGGISSPKAIGRRGLLTQARLCTGILDGEQRVRQYGGRAIRWNSLYCRWRRWPARYNGSPRLITGRAGWRYARILDYSLLRRLHISPVPVKALAPRSSTSAQLKMAYNEIRKPWNLRLDVIWQLRLHERTLSTRPPIRLRQPTVSLWNHNAQERDAGWSVHLTHKCSQVRPGMEDEGCNVWATASRAHLNLEFRFNSQPLSS